MMTRVGARMRARRERLNMKQEDLATALGLPHRQTIGSIEAGERRLQPAEMAAAAKALGVRIDYFTDPFHAAGEAAFSFRADDADEAILVSLEEAGGRWLATYEELAKPSPIRRSVSLRPQDSYEKAQAAGEAARRALGLGPFPAVDLANAVEREWGVLVLYIDAPGSVSGAASRLHGVDAVMLNRAESFGRRNYDLAHEIFHLLTWDSMPPARLDTQRSGKSAKRIEELANNFAAALLMPEDSVRVQWAQTTAGSLAERVVAMAARFAVSAPAMKWRLVNLNLLEKKDAPSDAELCSAGLRTQGKDVSPPLFNNKLVSLIHRAVEAGELSVRKAASILGTTSHGLVEVFRSHGRALSYEL